MPSFSARIYNMGEGVRIALEAMRSNKVRASLTILGVAVGVFVVVVISAAIHGINQSVAADFESAGPTTFFLQRYPITFEACDGSDDTCKWRSNPPLTFAELAALQRLESVSQAGAEQEWSAAVRYRDRVLSSTAIDAFTGNWALLGAPEMVEGRAFTDPEARSAARVAVLNTVAKERLLGDSDPIGKVITISGGPFEVIGVYKDNSSFLSGGSDHPKIVMPILSLQRHLNGDLHWMGFAVKPREGVRPDEAIDEVTASLRAMRGLRPGRESNFVVLTQAKLFETYDKIFGMFFLVMIALSAVGLLVGGVGVVAIMMISVTERTREIGVRKALGATRGTILWQFLIEAITLTATGAMLGLFVGWLVALFVRHATPIAASVPPGAVLAALVASAFTGILFGMLPAARAAKLDPVDALRYE
jgi:putative ABC transport system permease protein